MKAAGSPRGAGDASSLAWSALVLVALAIVAYANADHELFLFDSKHIVQVDSTEDALGALRDFREARLNPDAPLTFLTFAWNHAFNRAVGLEGFEVTTFLVVNVLLHALNALLLLALVRELLRRSAADERVSTWLSLALSALFVVHPLHASSVAYIIQRRGLLATTFYLLGVLCFLRARGRRPGSVSAIGESAVGLTWSRLMCLAAIPVCYWLSFRSKSLGLTLPLALLVIELCLRAREGVPLKKTLAPLVGALALSAGGILVFLGKRGLVDLSTLRIGHFGPEPGWGLWEHVLTEARVFVHYWKLLLLPLPRWSSIDHDVVVSRTLLDQMAGVAVLFHLLLLALAVVAARRGRTLVAMGIGWFYVTLIPYAFLPQRELFAEYKTYLPSVGLFLILAGVLPELRHRVASRFQIAALGVLIALSLAVTLNRNVIYQSRVDLWADAVQKAPGKWRPHYNLGSSLIEEGRFEEAEPHLAEALRLDPELYPAHSNLAGVLVELGRLDEATAHYREVVRLRPEWPKAHYRLANTLARTGRNDKAIEHYSTAVALDPDFVEAHANLAVVLTRAGQLGEAVEHFETASKLSPDSAVLQRQLRRSRERAEVAPLSTRRAEPNQSSARPAPPSPPN